MKILVAIATVWLQIFVVENFRIKPLILKKLNKIFMNGYPLCEN